MNPGHRIEHKTLREVDPVTARLAVLEYLKTNDHNIYDAARVFVEAVVRCYRGATDVAQEVDICTATEGAEVMAGSWVGSCGCASALDLPWLICSRPVIARAWSATSSRSIPTIWA